MSVKPPLIEVSKLEGGDVKLVVKSDGLSTYTTEVVLTKMQVVQLALLLMRSVGIKKISRQTPGKALITEDDPE